VTFKTYCEIVCILSLLSMEHILVMWMTPIKTHIYTVPDLNTWTL